MDVFGLASAYTCPRILRQFRVISFNHSQVGEYMSPFIRLGLRFVHLTLRVSPLKTISLKVSPLETISLRVLITTIPLWVLPSETYPISSHQLLPTDMTWTSISGWNPSNPHIKPSSLDPPVPTPCVSPPSPPPPLPRRHHHLNPPHTPPKASETHTLLLHLLSSRTNKGIPGLMTGTN